MNQIAKVIQYRDILSKLYFKVGHKYTFAYAKKAKLALDHATLNISILKIQKLIFLNAINFSSWHVVLDAISPLNSQGKSCL
jgi:hypothetical protein